MKRRDFVTGAALTASFAACSSEEKLPDNKTAYKDVYKWNMVTSWPPNLPGLGLGANKLAEDVEKALLADPTKKAAPPENPMSADRVKWEHIHRVFELCNRNVSETARRLKMHRRTLQRILSKRSPR